LRRDKEQRHRKEKEKVKEKERAKERDNPSVDDGIELQMLDLEDDYAMVQSILGNRKRDDGAGDDDDDNDDIQGVQGTYSVQD
jgi:hypothetical protein